MVAMLDRGSEPDGIDRDVVGFSGEHEGFTVQVPGDSTATIDVEFPSDRAGSWGVGRFVARGCNFVAGLEGTLNVQD